MQMFSFVIQNSSFLLTSRNDDLRLDIIRVKIGEYQRDARPDNVAKHLKEAFVAEERGALVVICGELHCEGVVCNHSSRPADRVVEEVEEGKVPDVGRGGEARGREAEHHDREALRRSKWWGEVSASR